MMIQTEVCYQFKQSTGKVEVNYGHESRHENLQQIKFKITLNIKFIQKYSFHNYFYGDIAH